MGGRNKTAAALPRPTVDMGYRSRPSTTGEVKLLVHVMTTAGAG
jgi:hypothetical protein